MAAWKGLDQYNMLGPKATVGTKEDLNLVPSVTNKRVAGCICEEDHSLPSDSACTKVTPSDVLTVEHVTRGYSTSWSH